MQVWKFRSLELGSLEVWEVRDCEPFKFSSPRYLQGPRLPNSRLLKTNFRSWTLNVCKFESLGTLRLRAIPILKLLRSPNPEASKFQTSNFQIANVWSFRVWKFERLGTWKVPTIQILQLWRSKLPGLQTTSLKVRSFELSRSEVWELGDCEASQIDFSPYMCRRGIQKNCANSCPPSPQAAHRFSDNWPQQENLNIETSTPPRSSRFLLLPVFVSKRIQARHIRRTDVLSARVLLVFIPLGPQISRG